MRGGYAVNKACTLKTIAFIQREPPPDQQRRLEEADLFAAVERALAELPTKRAEVCKLRLIGELSYAQIAQRLGISEKTVETQLARGLKFLRERIRA